MDVISIPEWQKVVAELIRHKGITIICVHIFILFSCGATFWVTMLFTDFLLYLLKPEIILSSFC